MDLKNFYLNTPLDRSDFVRIKLANISQEVIDKYKLKELACDSWVYSKNATWHVQSPPSRHPC
jgi:hypothetical protein